MSVMQDEKKVLDEEALKNMEELVPEILRPGFLRYFHYRVKPGVFLTAVLENDLSRAVAFADPGNVQMIPAVVHWLWNFVPMSAWGSKEKVQAWLEGASL